MWLQDPLLQFRWRTYHCLAVKSIGNGHSAQRIWGLRVLDKDEGQSLPITLKDLSYKSRILIRRGISWITWVLYSGAKIRIKKTGERHLSYPEGTFSNLSMYIMDMERVRWCESLLSPSKSFYPPEWMQEEWQVPLQYLLEQSWLT